MSAALIRALQLGDSAFPSGGFAHSWGLESAVREGLVDRASFAAWLEFDMLGRWAQFDRPALAMAHRADDPLAVDAEIDLRIWAEPLRRRSAEAGQAFLTATARLGDPVAATLREAAFDGRAQGHLPVAQGAVFRSLGLSLDHALAVSAHAAAQAVATAAVRLGLVGAMGAQAALAALAGTLAEAVAPPPPGTEPAAFAPVAEIAMLRAPDGALFAS